MNLKDLIIRATSDDKEAMLSIITKFDPLLKKHSRHLNYDDAYNDMVLDFIEFIRSYPINKMRETSDGAFVNYIQKAVYHAYLKRACEKAKQPIIKNMAELDEVERFHIDVNTSVSDIYFEKEVITSFTNLTKVESEVLQLLYEGRYSVTEVATILGKSRQSINQTKRRALRKIEKTVR